MSALILDGQLKSALCTVRSLGEKGVKLCVGAERPSAASLHSRYAHTPFVYASPKKDPQQFLRDIEAAARNMDEKPVLLAFSDATALLLAREYARVREWAILLQPALSSVEVSADKEATYLLAQRLKIKTIRTYTQEQFAAVAFPAVVKNRHSIVWKEGKAVEGSARFVFSQEELKKSFREITEKTGEAPLIMEFITGEEYGIEMVCTEGVPLCTYAHKRIRSLSPKGGAAVVKEGAQDTEAVQQMQHDALRLVAELSWTGPVMVEFKVDAQNGNVYLMEINGRFWGSLPLAVAAGVDVPWCTYALAQGKVYNAHESAASFNRTRHFLGDCRWLLSVLFAHDRMRTILYPSRFSACGAFLKEFFLSKGDVWKWNDPLPSLFEYIDILSTWR